MPAPTLLAMAQRQLLRSAQSLVDVGDAPYEAVRPALRKIVAPSQLRAIEIASPHIAEADAELWIAMLERDIPGYRREPVKPKNPNEWGKLYEKLSKREKEKEEENQRMLREAMEADKKSREEGSTRLLKSTIYDRFRQGKFLDGNPNPHALAFGFERVGSVANAKKTGKNVIAAIRKAATKPPGYKIPIDKAATPTVQPRMWQQPAPAPRVRARDRNLSNLPLNLDQRLTTKATEKALKEDARIREEQAKRAAAAKAKTHSLTPPWAAEGEGTAGPHAKPAENGSAKPSAASPPQAAGAAVSNTSTATMSSGAGTKRRLDAATANPAPPAKRPRPQSSIFIPKKVKR